MTKHFGATHVDTSDNSRGTWFSFVKAFTLAEVLITLGIIGVVAAMTIPTLVKNYQKQVWVNQLKKSVSTLEQGFQKMLADDGVDSLDNSSFRTEMDKEDPVYGQDYVCVMDIEFKDFHNYLSKYFNILKFYDGDDEGCSVGNWYKRLDEKGTDQFDSDLRKIYLADGTVFGMWAYVKCNNEKICGKIAIDVNGDTKGPNQWGRDTFAFYLTSTGHLIPNMGSSYDDCSTNGFACSKRIIENGWKMDY